MSQEGADAVRRLRREDVLELAGLLLDDRFILNTQGLHKEPLSQPVAPDDALRPLASLLRELDRLHAVIWGIVSGVNHLVAAVQDHLMLVRVLFAVRPPGDEPHAHHLLDGEC